MGRLGEVLARKERRRDRRRIDGVLAEALVQFAVARRRMEETWAEEVVVSC